MGKANAEKTHCPSGHPYDEANTYRSPRGERRCRRCHNEQVKGYYAADPEPVRTRRREEWATVGEHRNRQQRVRRAGEDGGLIRERERARYAESPAKRLSIWSRRHSGLTPGAWDALWQEQQGRCYLCGDALDSTANEPGKTGGNRRVVVDHDHSCCRPGRSCERCRRGLACGKCNLAIGLLNHDPARLRRVADALEKAQMESRCRT